MNKILLTPITILVFFSAFSQSAQDKFALHIKKKLGENCIIKDENGSHITFESAADQTLSAYFLGKKAKYDPLKVIEGDTLEVILRLVDPASIKSTVSEIDFSNKNLGFYSEAKQKIEAKDFKKIIRSNPNLDAAAYNANDGIIKDYYIVTKPKPEAIKMMPRN